MQPPDSAQSPNITGYWVLRPEGQPLAGVVAWMILELRGAQLLARGDSWSGKGIFDSGRGYYDWQFEDGRTGHTEFYLSPDGVLHGQVRGSGIDWDYRAVRAACPQPPPSSPLQRTMEESLVENPDDLATHSAYADHLMEQGDPRGEFIRVQLQLEDPTCTGNERKRLQDREQELLRAHQRQWLGEMARFFQLNPLSPYFPPAMFDYRFERGWLTFVRIERLSIAFMTAFDTNPLLRLLRHLVIPRRDYDAPGYEEQDDFALLAQSPYLGNVRQFQLGIDERCDVRGEWAAALVSQMPKLEELRLYAHNVDTDALFALSLPRLRLLEVHHVHHYALEVLAENATLTNLEHLSLWPHMLEPGDELAYITPEGARALVNSRTLPKLRVLELRNSDLGDEGCAEIVRSGLLERLKVLNLTNGVISDAGARTLAACADLKNVELLNVSGNRLTEAGLAALRATGIRVESAQQHGEDFEGRYLWEGDME